MWREFIESLGLTCFFNAPTTREELDEVETALGSRLPPELRELLTEANGVAFKPRFSGEPGVAELAAEGDWALGLVWSTAEIAEQNDRFRFWDQGVAPPVHDLIFFGAQPNGDPVALLHKDAGEDRPGEVVIMSHEDSTDRRVISPSLRDHLTTFLLACQ